ncbi:MAG: hypothetical protein ABFC34_16785 [Methanobacterium sp.]
MHEFESFYKDEYNKLIDELTDKNEPRLYEVETNIPGAVFLTEIDNDDYNVIREVNPKVRMDDWDYTVV